MEPQVGVSSCLFFGTQILDTLLLGELETGGKSSWI
jgi:hypothetical protein